MASQVYFEGDWYVALDTTAPGESPATAPDKWARQDIPAMFERYLVQATYARLLPSEGQNDKRSMETNRADELLLDTVLRDNTAIDFRGDQRARVAVR